MQIFDVNSALSKIHATNAVYNQNFTELMTEDGCLQDAI